MTTKATRALALKHSHLLQPYNCTRRLGTSDNHPKAAPSNALDNWHCTAASATRTKCNSKPHHHRDVSLTDKHRATALPLFELYEPLAALPVSFQTVSRPLELSLQSSLQLSLKVLVCYWSRGYIEP